MIFLVMIVWELVLIVTIVRIVNILQSDQVLAILIKLWSSLQEHFLSNFGVIAW